MATPQILPIAVALQQAIAHRQAEQLYCAILQATGQTNDALNILQATMPRGLNTPTAQALRQKGMAAVPNNPAW